MALACWPGLVACSNGSTPSNELPEPDSEAVRAELVELFAGDHPGEDSTEGRLDDETIRTATIAALMARWSDPAVEDLSVAQSVCSKTSLPQS